MLAMGSGPLIWGEPGTNGQHSFFQWLHQGTDIVPVDILVPRQPNGVDQFTSPTLQAAAEASHRTLAVNAVAQAEALALGSENKKQPHRHFAGNRPSALISWIAQLLLPLAACWLYMNISRRYPALSGM